MPRPSVQHGLAARGVRLLVERGTPDPRRTTGSRFVAVSRVLPLGLGSVVFDEMCRVQVSFRGRKGLDCQHGRSTPLVDVIWKTWPSSCTKNSLVSQGGPLGNVGFHFWAAFRELRHHFFSPQVVNMCYVGVLLRFRMDCMPMSPCLAPSLLSSLSHHWDSEPQSILPPSPPLRGGDFSTIFTI